jgi:putative N6-adenine-specific DNA methylase
MQFLIKTLAGLEPVLEKELIKIGMSNIQVLTRGFACEGDMAMMYRANYTLRTALRILIPVHEFRARNEMELYEGIRQVKWSDYMHVTQTLAVDAVCRSLVFTNSHYVALKTKDAIVDQFRDLTRRRPNINAQAPNLLIHVHIHEDKVSVLLDSSGGSLHRRGYRHEQVEAPLNEVLAAGMVMLSGWDGTTTFFDPMCGSGTLPTEAAMIALKIPAQYHRESLGFHRWYEFDKRLWAEVKGEVDAKIETKLEAEIHASDRDPRARNISAVNMMAAGVGEHIRLQKGVFEQLKPPTDTGLLMFNPPYDERMREDDIIAVYRGIGDTMKQKFINWDAWIISSNRSAIKNIGLRPEKKFTVFNGALECSFQKFSMWQGGAKPIVTE